MSVSFHTPPLTPLFPLTAQGLAKDQIIYICSARSLNMNSQSMEKKFIPIYTDLMLKERMLKNDVLFGKSQK